MMSSGADHRPSRLTALLLAPLLLLCLSCERLSPEEQVRRMIEEAFAAALEGDTETLGQMVSERYSDPRGNGKRELQALVGFHLCQEGSLHLLKRVRSIRPAGPDRVEAQLLVAAAGVPIDDLMALDRFSADLLLVDLVFEKEARALWRVVEARWRRAEPADLL